MTALLNLTMKIHTNPLKNHLHLTAYITIGLCILAFLSLCICLLCSVSVGISLSDFSSSAAAHLSLVIMGRTPHRGRQAFTVLFLWLYCHCCSYTPILKHTNMLQHQSDHETNTETSKYSLTLLNTSFEFLVSVFFSELFQSQVLCVHSHSNYSLYISRSHFLMRSSIIF